MLYARNGQIFDIYADQQIDDVFYPRGWFYGEEERSRSGVVLVTETACPNTLPSQKLVSNLVEVDGEWVQNWAIVAKTEDELAADAAALTVAKAEKNLAINAARAIANQTSFTHLGKTIQCDPLSRSDIDAVANHVALLGTFPPGFPGAWKAVDNSYLVLPNVDAFKAMYVSMTSQGTANFQKSQELKSELALAEKLEDVNNIHWS